MISLSELLGGRRRRRKKAQKKASTTKKAPRRRVRRSRGKGIVGGDLELANMMKQMGGIVGADPAVLNYYQNLAAQGGARRRKKKSTTKRSGSSRSQSSSALTKLYDPVVLNAAISRAAIDANLEKYKEESKKKQDRINNALANIAVTIPKREDPYTLMERAATALLKGREQGEIEAAKRQFLKSVGEAKSEEISAGDYLVPETLAEFYETARRGRNPRGPSSSSSSSATVRRGDEPVK
jgi:hypothetical protein